MAITVDAISQNAGTHTCTGASMLVLHIPGGGTATYNGVSMTSAVSSSGAATSEMLYLNNPASGTNTLSVSGGTWSAVSYIGTDGIDATSGANSAFGFNSALVGSITTTTNNCWIASALAISGSTVTNTASTSQVNRAPSSSFANETSWLLDTNSAVSTGTFNFTTSWSGSRQSAITAIAIKPYVAFTFTGPASGNVNSASTNFTVTPPTTVTGTVTITPTGAGSVGLSPTVLTFSSSAVAQTFTITPLTAGAITLTMTNGCGQNNASPLTYTAIAVVPGAPTIGTATPGNTNASITFTAPTSDGGAPITLYTATSTPSSITGTSATSPVTVTGLVNGTPYTFKVKATNSAGTGPESSASNSATPYVPATTFTFTGPSSGNVRSASTNFTVTPNAVYYGTITLTPSGAGSTGLNPTVLTWSGTSTAQTFTITPQTSGVITLTPTNSNGLSNPSNLNYTANAVVPLAPSMGLAIPSLSSALVTVGAPTNDGGSAVTLYTVTSSPAGGTGTSTSAGQVVVTGLTNGTSYTFTATATNAIGTSSASSASNAVIPRANSVDFANTGPNLNIQNTVGNLISSS